MRYFIAPAPFALLLAAAVVLRPAPASAVELESELLTAQAEALLSQGDGSGALELLGEALEVDPTNERAQVILVRAHVVSGDAQAALDIIDILLEAHPADGALLREQGYIYLIEGDTMWALEALQEALAADPDDTIASLYLGYAALLLDSPEDALELLDTASRDPEVQGSATYLHALALERSGQFDLAFQVLGTAVDSGIIDPSYAHVAHDLHGDLKKRVIPFALVDIGLSAGLQYDSNVALLTQDLASISPGSYDSFGAVLAGSMFVRPLRGRTWAIGAGGSVLQTFNFNKRVEDFNTTVWGITAEFVKLFRQSSPLRSFKLRYLQSLVCLWGGDMVDFDHYYRFSNSYGADVTAEFSESDWGVTRVRMLWRYGVFTDYGRDNMGFTASVNQTFMLLERKLKLAAELSLRVEHASSLAWNQVAPRVFVGGSFLLPAEIQILAAFAYEHEDHNHSGPTSRWGSHRVDDVFVYSAGLSRTFIDQLTLSASFAYTDNRSTLTSTYDFDRWVVAVTFSWRKK